MFTQSDPPAEDALKIFLMKLLSPGLVLMLVVLASCGGKKGSGGSSDSSGPETKPAPAESAEAVKGEVSWCALDAFHGSVYTTTRITFGEKKAKVEYIRTGEETKPAIYVKNDAVMYERKSEAPVIDDRFVIEEVSGEATVAHLENFDEQRYQLEKILSNHQGITVPGYFIPKRALIIETKIILPQRKTILYPCADFTPSLNGITNARPLIEFDIEKGQVDLTHAGTFAPLAKELSLKLPIEHVKPDFSAFFGKQFCAWSEFAPNSSAVEVLSIGKNFFRMNSYADYKLEKKDLEANARQTWMYVATSMKDILAGRTERTYPSGEIISFEREFHLVTDARGKTVLIRKNKQVLPTDIYRECPEPRPTELYPKFKKALPYILELEATEHK